LEKLDIKDRKILYHLDINSRQSFSQIGKKVGLHKDVVTYRVKKLQDTGIIKGFQTIINTSVIGNSWYRFYFTFQYTYPDIVEDILNYYVNVKYSHAVILLQGQYDLLINTHVKNENKAYSLWKNILSKYRDYFSQQVFSVIYKSYEYRYTFLLEGINEKKPENLRAQVCGSENRIEIDELDYKILGFLTNNSRTPTVEIADKLNINTNTVKNRIKKMMDIGLIRGFRLSIDLAKIAYSIYKSDIVLKDHNKIKKIMEYIHNNNQYLQGIIRSIGYVDLELVFYLNNPNQLHEIMKDLSLKFPNTIKNYKYFRSLRTAKWVFSYEE
jgi:DNA-binding Lrp family transcriptional regulator